jgi:hypothetical protein
LNEEMKARLRTSAVVPPMEVPALASVVTADDWVLLTNARRSGNAQRTEFVALGPGRARL